MPLPVTFWAREDSGSANNPSLNLTGADAIEISLVAETANGDPGDLYLDQPAGGGVDPDTQVEINGVLYSFTYELGGILPTLKHDGAGQVPDQFEGSIVSVITVQDYPTAGETMRLVFLPEEEATQADMDAFGNGAISVQAVDDTPPPTPVCFGAGTLLKTPYGETLVEDLTVGDLVLTADHGPVPVRWIGLSSFKWSKSFNKHKPILIAAGAMGAGLPRRDLLVSPQHKVLLRGRHVEEEFGVDEVLAPARGLTGLAGVRSMNGKRECVYVHILLDSHGLLDAFGVLSESFFPGPTAMKMLGAGQRREVLDLFPALGTDPEGGYGSPARRCLSVREANDFCLRHRRATAVPAVATKGDPHRHNRAARTERPVRDLAQGLVAAAQ